MSSLLLFERPKLIGAPSLIADGRLWYDAWDLSTITKDGSNNVSSFANKFSTSIPLAQASGAAQPFWNANSNNGLPGIEFNGSSHILTASDNAILDVDASGVTWFIVQRHVQFNSHGSTLNSLLCHGSAVHASQNYTFSYDSFGSANILNFKHGNSQATTFLNTADNVARILSCTKTDAATGVTAAYSNGTQTQTETGQTALSDNNGTFAVGGDPTVSTRFWQGSISEILMYGRVLATAERQFIERYLGRKWGITVA